MDNTTVVNSEPTTPSGEPNAPEDAGGEPQPQAGDKTPSHLLLKSLQEERQKVKELEETINQLKSSPTSEDVFSDEGKVLDSKIKTLENELSTLRTESSRKDVLITYPVLKDKWSEFEEFRNNPENKGMNMRTAAKSFLVENGFFEPTRQGLEKPTGGAGTPSPTSMTADDVKTLRETNWRKYQELVKSGQIKIAE